MGGESGAAARRAPVIAVLAVASMLSLWTVLAGTVTAADPSAPGVAGPATPGPATGPAVDVAPDPRPARAGPGERPARQPRRGDPRNAPPSPEVAVSPGHVAVGDVVSLDATGSVDSDGHILVYQWDVDDDGFYERAGSRTQYVFTEPGYHAVRLKVQDDGGATGVTRTLVLVHRNEFPEPRLRLDPGQPTACVPVGFDATGSSDPDGRVRHVNWDFDGDGSYDDAGATASYTFESVGLHEVRLYVTDDKGATSVAHRQLDVGSNRPPTVAFALEPDEPRVGEPVRLDASGSTDPEGDPLEFRWDLDGDGGTDAVSEKPTYSFDEPGDHLVGLEVVDDCGLTARKLQVVSVRRPSLPGPLYAVVDWVTRRFRPAELSAIQTLLAVLGGLLSLLGFGYAVYRRRRRRDGP